MNNGYKERKSRNPNTNINKQRLRRHPKLQVTHHRQQAAPQLLQEALGSGCTSGSTVQRKVSRALVGSIVRSTVEHCHRLEDRAGAVEVGLQSLDCIREAAKHDLAYSQLMTGRLLLRSGHRKLHFLAGHPDGDDRPRPFFADRLPSCAVSTPFGSP